MTSSLDPSNLFSARGLVAVVTGGGTGIGLMMATALENNGATVYIVGRRKEVLEKAAKENAKYGKIIPIQGDVTSRDSLLSVVSSIDSQSGYINLLVNNSGIYGPRLKELPSTTSSSSIKELQTILWESLPEEFNRTFEVNVTAVYYTTVAFLELLDNGNIHGGIPGVTSQVITTASISGFRRDDKHPGIAYRTSKAAAILLGKILANVLKDWQIRKMTPVPENGEVSPDIVPMKRLGTKEDMAGTILYLATRAGAFVTGNVSVNDGGALGLVSATY